MSSVVAVDLRGIQSFVFSTRSLLDAVGRAAVIADLTDPTHTALRQCLPLGTRLVSAAAGALVVACPDRAAANVFAARYTRLVRDTSDQLEPVVAVLDAAAAEQDPELIPRALLAARAGSAAAHQPTPDPGFTAVCEVTARPGEDYVTSRDRGDEVLAADVVAARGRGRAWLAEQQQRVDAIVRGRPLDGDAAVGAELTSDLDRLGRTEGVRSQLAVLHADITGLGNQLRACDRANLPAVSTALRGVIQDLSDHLVDTVWRHIEPPADGNRETFIGGFPSRLRFPLDVVGRSRRRVVLPLRPLVIAGDDLTVVCDARLVFTLARAILQWLNEPLTGQDSRDTLANADDVFLDLSRDEMCLNLRIGIGIATFPVGAPLAGPHDTAVALCDFAKEHLNYENITDHAVAWTTRRLPAGQVLAGLTRDHRQGLTAQPYTGTGFLNLLEQYLGPQDTDDGHGSLRGPTLSAARGWVKTDLATLARTSDQALATEVQRRSGAGNPTPLPQGHTRGQLLDGIDIMDLHLDLNDTDADAAAAAGAGGRS